MPVQPLLEVDALRTDIRTRDSTVRPVDGVSLHIDPGETVGLVGESGCGKSMTGLSIMRLLPPGGRVVGGTVCLDGVELTALPNSKMRHIRGNDAAMVFQDPMTALNPTMTIGAQIAEPVRGHRGASKKEALERATDVLDLVGMPRPRERLRAYPHELSGGLRQRAVIAIALACEPKLLIADEPTTALDVTIQSQILALLDDLKGRLGMSMLLITHDMGVIAGRADRVMVMYAGRIVESTSTQATFSDMRHPYTEALLESIPDLETDRSTPLRSISGLPPNLADPPRGCRFAPRCRYVQERCVDEDPALTEDEAAHQYACFFPLDGLHPSGEPGTPRAGSLSARAVAAGTAADHPDDLLVLEHVVKEFPVRRGVLQRKVGAIKAVSDVSFTVRRGEIFGLVGESGCGKTTLGRLVVSLEKAGAGRITYNGEDVSSLRGRARRRRRADMQLVFQDPYASLDPRMRISSTLREPLVAQGRGNRGQQKTRITELLAEVGLPVDALGRYPHEFSGGQRQRIGLARALTLGPRLVVADEPVSALDVSIQAQVLNLMARLQTEHDLTYIVISHDLSVVRYLADRIGVMYLGKLVEIGPTRDIYATPVHPYTAGLLDSVPLPDPVRERLKESVPVKGELPSAENPPSGCRFRTRCPRAQQLCADQEPPLRAFGAAGHQAACHFPLRQPTGADARTAG